uniref:Uncharacterized protein n=1 Tax=Lepeophtheirus salmonis TaxID=72036 RepID=A0A0K2TAC3_LEPSM
MNFLFLSSCHYYFIFSSEHHFLNRFHYILNLIEHLLVLIKDGG